MACLIISPKGHQIKAIRRPQMEVHWMVQLGELEPRVVMVLALGASWGFVRRVAGGLGRSQLLSEAPTYRTEAVVAVQAP